MKYKKREVHLELAVDSLFTSVTQCRRLKLYKADIASVGLRLLHTLILLPAVVGRPFFSALRLSGNKAWMKELLKKDKRQEDVITDQQRDASEPHANLSCCVSFK